MIGQVYELQAVFFDLDGTLVDSAPDLVVAMQRLRAELGETPVDVTAIGQVVSKGGRAMLRRGFADADDARIELLLPRFLDLYAEAIATHTRLYAGMDDVLGALETAGLRWGVVTNKPGWLARSLIAAISLDRRCAALVSGDCLPQRKPDPAPLHAAILRAGGGRAAYVGDSTTDTDTARAAGIPCVAVTFGFADRPPEELGATALIDHFDQLIPTLRRLA